MELKPKLGIGQVVFGMKRLVIESMFGKPDKVVIDEESEGEILWEYNIPKLRLSFFEELDCRFGYLRTANEQLTYNGKAIMGQKVDIVKNEVFADLNLEWEIDEYTYWTTHFNESLWLTLIVEYGCVTEIEMGVPFQNEDDYDWPDLDFPSQITDNSFWN